MKKKHKLIDLVYDFRTFTESDLLWASVPEPQILWLIKQDPDRYIVEQAMAYAYDDLGPMRAEIWVTFTDDRLETEYLLKFSDRISPQPYIF